MNDVLHRTDTLNPIKEVICGKQKQHWVEFQLLDELGEPLANLPFRAENDATRSGCAAVLTGQSDESGVIRLEGLHPLDICLKLVADPLAEELSTRRLRAERPEPPRPGVGDPTPLYGPQRSGFSPIEKQAHAEGNLYHYLRIGQLCDQLPSLGNEEDLQVLPEFHFPDPEFNGFTVVYEQLSMRHVVEVCPFRAWSLVLHHQQHYSLANAYNLGLMSILSYSDELPDVYGSVSFFFAHQCMDLSRTPRVDSKGQAWPCLVVDVPFKNRYTSAELMDTNKAKPPQGHTQFFYALSKTQWLVVWRGTEPTKIKDIVTDVSFRPVRPSNEYNCDFRVPCPDLVAQGSVHTGFFQAFKVAREVYSETFKRYFPQRAEGRDLFVCGHSLGGALALIHAASLKERDPLVYTYGMPRTFTLDAVKGLSWLRHFRHVNDSDFVPQVPPEADLDSHFYKLYGPLGTSLGLKWSMAKMAASIFFEFGDPFSHHGEIVLFLMTEQHVERKSKPFPAYRGGRSGPAYPIKILYRLPERTKLFLVPSLDESDDLEAEKAQKRLVNSLAAEDRNKFFKPYKNPDLGGRLSAGNHSMDEYQPYIHNQLLESISPERIQARQIQRSKFEQQMMSNSERIPESEFQRNRMFLDLQNRLGKALVVTRQIDGGSDALRRFEAATGPKVYCEKTYC
ncbi:lipase family protein [Pseudomonas sp. NPDC089547]|uniref:lipase family protein n=1 Tax=Pseudomonas sp. NPDC089547 TaxID=3390652 RepID=UPI003CFBD9A2